MKNRILYIDTETTGSKYDTMKYKEDRDKIWEIAMIDETKSDYQTFVNPNQQIPHFIVELTGLKAKDINAIKKAAPFRLIAQEVWDYIFTDSNGEPSSPIFVAHNAPFDKGFILSSFSIENERFDKLINRASTEKEKDKIRSKKFDLQKIRDMKTICTLALSRKIYPNEKKHTLDAVSDRLKIEIDGREKGHRAYIDATIASEILKELTKNYTETEMEKLPDELKPKRKKLKINK